MVHLSKWLRARGLDVGDVTSRAGRGVPGAAPGRWLRLVLLTGEPDARCWTCSPGAGHRWVEPALAASEVDALLAGYRRLPAAGARAGGLDDGRVRVAGAAFPVAGYGHGADLAEAGQQRGDPGGAARSGHGVGWVGAVLRGGAAFVPALRLPDGLDRHRPVRGVAAGDRPAAVGAAAGHQPGRREGAAASVRSAHGGRPPRLRGHPDPAAAGAAGLRGGRAAAGRHRLAGRRDHRARQGAAGRPAAAAGRCRRGDRRVSAARAAPHRPTRGVLAGHRAADRPGTAAACR